MATIITKFSSTSSAVPSASDLVQGELAVNTADKRLFTENNSGVIIELGTNPSSITTGAITATGTVTANSNLSSSNAVLTGGTVNGVVVGGSTPQAITGTLITANTNFAGALTGNVTGNITGNLTGNVTGNLTGNVTASSGTTTLNNLVLNGTVDFNAAELTDLATPTAASSAATKGYVDTEVAGLVDSAPGTLDTLNELAAALGDDPDFATTITNQIATKLALAGGTMTGAIAMGTNKITGLGTPTASADAVNKTYADTMLPLAGGTMTGNIVLGSNKATSTATPSAADDLTRKGYVDGILGSATSAATSAATATTKASEASTSASNAATSATAAASSATSAAASYDSFDDRYLGAKSSNPSTDNDGDALLTGALFFNTTANELRVYTGSAWTQAAFTSSGLSDIVADTTPQLGGTLDVNGQDIGSVSNGNILLTPNGSGVVRVDGTNGIDMESGAISIKNSGAQSYVRFYCEASNAHYAQLQSPAHSEFAGNVIVTLPATTDTLVGRATTDTLTNKTLTSADINTPDIDGGTIDNTVIGGSTAAAGSFTTLSASTSFTLGGVAITSTAAELNILDGVTSTTAELNILDGVTSTTAELNILDGVTSTAAELNILDGVTSTAAELNILDGVTSTAAELNILDGVTSTTAELNILDGVTSTATELNILDALSRGSLIYGNASAATAILTKGAANTVLTSDGTDIAWAAAAGGGGLLGTQAFTGSGSWTVPSGVTKALVFCTGGGGGSNGQSNGGGSGGAGGTAIKLYTVVEGQSATVTIGAAGSNTGAGGNSTFVYDSTTITGNGGSAATSSTAGISGTASGGDVNLSGGAGTSGSNVRCPGGASFWGGGSQGATGNYQGPNANGALGSGAGSAGGNSSGAGKAGFVLVVF